MDRWVEHKQFTNSGRARNWTHTGRAHNIDSLNIGKSPGNDAIPPEINKHGRLALLHNMYERICQYWKRVQLSRICGTLM